jgi:hypothetical protein
MPRELRATVTAPKIEEDPPTLSSAAIAGAPLRRRKYEMSD